MRFRVATINLMAPAGPFLPWGDRAEGLARLLALRTADLVGTQEATSESLQSLEAQFPDHDVLGRGRWASGGGIQCAILYRRDAFKVRDSGHFWLSRSPDRPGSKLPGMGSARLVLGQLSKLSRPWLVTGDFNATPWPRWSAHRILATQLRDLSSEAGATWNARMGLPIARLDWILGTSELRAVGSEVLRAGKSDHWPVLADIQLDDAIFPGRRRSLKDSSTLTTK